MKNYNTMADAYLESGNPPKYEATQPTEGQPPTYDSLYGEIKEARKNASGNGDFLKTFCGIIFNTSKGRLTDKISSLILICIFCIFFRKRITQRFPTFRGLCPPSRDFFDACGACSTITISVIIAFVVAAANRWS